ncbi:MAG: helix-turn-helix domain-containing protein [Ignavibacteria bacterium]|nr:helix-turn-helix domain-containing protein [Ignavibacteria bacterium]MBK7576622.1 helix-turn-helix domain-containing protein [Ignavibacteria bacterium]MBK9181759.1 helix-turn-helix domain-containing protein [Ignavibacteria bacterium]
MNFLSPSEIKTLREQTGLSQSKFGQLLGVTGGSVAHWESGLRTPPPIYHAGLLRLRDKVNTSDNPREIENILIGFILAGGLVAFMAWLFNEGSKSK